MVTARYVESPAVFEPRVGDWQASASRTLASEDCVVLNPRRAVFPLDDTTVTSAQVEWECRHRRLDHPMIMLFWFPASDPAVAVQPIALLELGAELAAPAPSCVAWW